MRRRKRKTGIQKQVQVRLGMEPLEARVVLDGAAAFTLLQDVPPSTNGGAPLPLEEFQPFSLDESELRSQLQAAPLESTLGVEEPLVFSIPAPDGSIDRFHVVETQMMEPELAAEFPQIKTYRGVGIDDPTATAVLDVTYLGFHAQVRSASGSWYVDPYYHLDSSVYASYRRDAMDATEVAGEWNEIGVEQDGAMQWLGENSPEDFQAGHHHSHDHLLFHDHGHSHGPAHSHGDQGVLDLDDHGPNCQCPSCCSTSESGGDLNALLPAGHTFDDGHDHGQALMTLGANESGGDGTGGLSLVPRTGGVLRTYRTAVAATTEYVNFHGGTVAAGQSAVVTAMNRVSGIYEDELTIRLVLVANNSSLIYAGADPYTNNNGFTMLGQNQSNIDSVIGNANYDVGHVFSTGGGGVAGLGVVGITGQKARGVTGLPRPTGDAFFVDYVAHELGHQYGARHTFNGDSGSCAGGNRTGVSAYEPGSGSTIMAYAGICGNDNIQQRSDDYFHSRSLDEVVSLVEARSSVGTRADTGNTIPTADAGTNFVIPAETPFELTGSGSDADGDALTYNWEQRNLGPQQDVNAGDNGSSPIFRSWSPTTEPTRVFPRLSNLLSNTTPRGETLPTTNRTLNFRLTVRDTNPAGGGVATDDMSVTVRNAAGPFQVTAPNTSVVWEGGSTQTVTWDVAGTTGNGINTSQVNLLLSLDGGMTYSEVLASGTANDGSEEIEVPNLQTTSARIKVEAVGNIFFDLSNQDFTINAVTDFFDPSAEAMASDLANPTGAAQIIEVTYTDDQAIDVSDIGSGDLRIVAPDGTEIPGILAAGPSSLTDASPVFATYSMLAPGGSWDPADVGTYSIEMVAGQVRDVGGNAVPAGEIGAFTVTFDDGPAPGDFDGNGALECADIDALTLAVAAADHDPQFDLTADGLVNADDLDEWVLELKGTLYGDANLDFVVDASDFNIWNVNKFQTETGWCQGNFDGDGVTDTSDFNIWNLNKFTAAAPELAVPAFATTADANHAAGVPRAAGGAVDATRVVEVEVENAGAGEVVPWSGTRTELPRRRSTEIAESRPDVAVVFNAVFAEWDGPGR